MAKKKRGAKGRAIGHRSHGRGTLVMDLTVAGVHIRRATGTRDANVFKLYRGMVDTLAAAGRIDILRQLANRQITFAEVWNVVRPHSERPVDLNRLPSPATMRELFGPEGALTQWIAARKCSAAHKLNMQRDARNLAKHAGVLRTLQDLPEIVDRWRDRCEIMDTPRTYNMARSTALAFVRDTLKRSHPIYGALLDLPILDEAREPGKPLEPDELPAWLDTLRGVLPEHYALEFQSMCFSGMRPVEYWGAEWEVLPDRIRVRTAKQQNQRRPVWREIPRVAALYVPTGVFSTWQDQLWKKGLHLQHTAYDGRRTFARACEEVGIPLSRIKHYLGHGVHSVTDRYLRHDIRPHLAADAAKLRAYFNLPDAPVGLQLVTAG